MPTPVTPPIDFPQVNGYFPSWSSIELGLGGIAPLQNLGVKAIDYKCKVNPASVYGAGSPQKIGETIGEIEADWSITVYVNQAAFLMQQLKTLLGDGYLTWRFPLNVHADLTGTGVIKTDKIKTARVNDISAAFSQGNEALVEKWSGTCFYVVKAGVAPIAGLPV